MNFLKQLGQALLKDVRRTLGARKVVFQIFGVPVLAITKRDAWHFNVFLFFLPLLQIVTGPKAHTVHILLLIWPVKAIKHLFTGWSYVRQEKLRRFAFCGRTIYEERVLEPYRFPSTTFRDKQVNG